MHCPTTTDGHQRTLSQLRIVLDVFNKVDPLSYPLRLVTLRWRAFRSQSYCLTQQCSKNHTPRFVLNLPLPKLFLKMRSLIYTTDTTLSFCVGWISLDKKPPIEPARGSMTALPTLRARQRPTCRPQRTSWTIPVCFCREQAFGIGVVTEYFPRSEEQNA